MRPSANLLELDHVTGRYGPSAAAAIDDVSLVLADSPGLVVIAGPNGSGKTTLLRLLAGQLPVASGHIHYCGMDVTEFPTHSRPGLAWLFQRSLDGMCPSLTVEENLSLMLMRGAPSAIRPLVSASRRRCILDTAQGAARNLPDDGGILGRLEDVLGRSPNEFSGGEIQQICMLALLLRDPPARIVLADEPTLNLDTENRRACLGMLAALAERGVVLLATHDSQLIERGVRRLVLEGGRLVRDEANSTAIGGGPA